jgi:hypothetical protein
MGDFGDEGPYDLEIELLPETNELPGALPRPKYGRDEACMRRGESMAACGGWKRVSGATAGGWYKGLDADKV